MINYFTAINIMFNTINKHINKVKYYKKNIINSINHFSYNKITANKNIPTFRNSAMDGYAIKYSNISSNNKKKKNYKIIGEIKAGDYYNNININKNNVIEIMTGAKMPKNFDSVIKVEDVLIRKKKYIQIQSHFKKYENVRFVGEDFKKYDIILNICEKINSNSVIILSAFGIKKIDIIKKPKIFILATGNEITNNTLTYNSKFKIYNSSTPYIIASLKNKKINFDYLGNTKDIVDTFIKKLSKILTCVYYSIFITTGGVSKGKYDFIPKTLKKLGIKIWFHHVNIKPGKPILFAKYKKHVYLFCLPGNPISSIVGLNYFVHPFLEYFLKQSFKNPLKAKLTNNIKKTFKKTTILKSFAFFKKATLCVKILKDQESFKINALKKSNSFVFIQKNDIIKKNMLTNIYLT